MTTKRRSRLCLLLAGGMLPMLLFSQETREGEEGPKAWDAAKLFTIAYPLPSRINFAGESARQVLEANGIVFNQGASAIHHVGRGLLIVRNTTDQHSLVEAFLGGDGGGDVLKILFEMIEVDRKRFGNWVYRNRLHGDGTDLRKEVGTWMEKGEAAILESVVLSTHSGMRAKSESVSEFIYPTENDPGEIPEETELNGRETKSPVVGPNPSAFEARNLGVTVELDPVLEPDGVTVLLNVAPRKTSLTGYSKWPPGAEGSLFQVRMPTFHQMEIITQMFVREGRYGFLGTTKPPEATVPEVGDPLVLHFIRVDLSSGAGKEGESRGIRLD